MSEDSLRLKGRTASFNISNGIINCNIDELNGAKLHSTLMTKVATGVIVPSTSGATIFKTESGESLSKTMLTEDKWGEMKKKFLSNAKYGIESWNLERQ